MECLKDELVALFKNDSSYKTSLTSDDKNKLKEIWSGIDCDRVIAFSLAKGLFKKQTIVFMQTGVRIDQYFYTLLGCIEIRKRGNQYDFIYVDEVATFKLSKDIIDYLQKMLSIIKKYEQKGHDCIYGNHLDREKALYYYNETIGLDYPYKESVFAYTAYGYYKRKKYYLTYAYCLACIKYNYYKIYGYYLIGEMYRLGLDVDKDVEKALYYYEEGLKLDPHDSNNCNGKALLYYYDLNKKDEVINIALQAKDITSSCLLLGYCYAFGYGCDVDINQSNEYLLKSLKNNKLGYWQLVINAIYTKNDDHVLEYVKEYSKDYKGSEYLYGKIYTYGIGVRIDYNKALDYYFEYLKLYPNNVNALYQIGKIYFNAEEYETAYGYFDACYKQGNVRCNYYLAEMYKNGYYVKQSMSQCLKLLKEGVKVDNSDCLVGMADYYFEESDDETLYEEAYHMLQKACIEESEDILAIQAYAFYVENKIGIHNLKEMNKHFEYICKIYEMRGRWFIDDYLRIKKLYIDEIIKASDIHKSKNLYELKGPINIKSLYIYSTPKYHVFLLLDYLEVVEVMHKYVDLKDDRLGSYYTVVYNRFNTVEEVKPRSKYEDL